MGVENLELQCLYVFLPIILHIVTNVYGNYLRRADHVSFICDQLVGSIWVHTYQWGLVLGFVFWVGWGV